jgi:hypothetical protein
MPVFEVPVIEGKYDQPVVAEVGWGELAHQLVCHCGQEHLIDVEGYYAHLYVPDGPNVELLGLNGELLQLDDLIEETRRMIDWRSDQGREVFGMLYTVPHMSRIRKRGIHNSLLAELLEGGRVLGRTA